MRSDTVMARLAGVSKQFIKGKETIAVFDRLDLAILQADFVAVMGPSGSGKTTLLNLVGRAAVEIAGGFVAEEELRIGHDCSRDRDALLLAARHLARVMLCPIGKVDHIKRRLDVPTALSRTEICQEQRQLDVVRRS